METTQCPICDELLPSYANYCGICGESLKSLENAFEPDVFYAGRQNVQYMGNEMQRDVDDIQDEAQQEGTEAVGSQTAAAVTPILLEKEPVAEEERLAEQVVNEAKSKEDDDDEHKPSVEEVVEEEEQGEHRGSEEEEETEAETGQEEILTGLVGEEEPPVVFEEPVAVAATGEEERQEELVAVTVFGEEAVLEGQEEFVAVAAADEEERWEEALVGFVDEEELPTALSEETQRIVRVMSEEDVVYVKAVVYEEEQAYVADEALGEETQRIVPVMYEEQEQTLSVDGEETVESVSTPDVASLHTAPLPSLAAREAAVGWSGLDDDDDPLAMRVRTLPRIRAVEVPTNSTPYAFNRGGARPATVKAVRRPRSGYTTAPLTYDTPTAIGEFEDPTRQKTWQKNVDASPYRAATATTLAPRPTQQRPILLEVQRRRRFKPTIIFWSSFGLLLVLLLGGFFSIFIAFGRGWLNPVPGKLSLTVTPDTVAVGATMTLRGANFTPGGRVGLTRDSSVAIADTDGAIIIDADSKGSFTDTVFAGGDWSPGPHTINAEDASTHKSAAYSILVTGNSNSLRPAHLMISVNSLDLGAADPATSSTKKITLQNLGGGQISWKTATSQSWLLVSPKSGSFASSQSAPITIAVDRSTLSVGPHAADIVFSSNAGNVTLPIKMQVTPLQPDHEAVLQLSPAVLSFTAIDGNASPPGQIVTVSNPGVQALSWQATSNVNWLSISPDNGNIASSSAPLIISGSTSVRSYLDATGQFIAQPGGTDNQSVIIKVNTSQLLPGSYSGVVTFSSTGSQEVRNSPQSVYVNVTVLPQCSLQVSPTVLSFTGVYLQAAPPAKTISVGGATSCSAPLSWTATSDANWLSIAPSSGSTPSNPAVSVDVTNLTPGTYSGSITFTSSAGTQVLPVSLTMGQPTTPIMMTSPATMSFSGVEGQPNPAAQPITITNTGGGVLSWQATATTAVGGAWLNVSLAGSNLSGGQSATVNVTATIGKSLIPGTYSGTVTITGVDATGAAAIGGPQTIPVTFVVQAACGLTPTPITLTYAGAVGQTAPVAQPVTIAASGACANPITWTVVTATNSGNWLGATPATGSATLAKGGTTSVAVSLTGLVAGTYTGTLTISAIDSVTLATVGTPQTVTVTLTVQPPCTLQVPSASTLMFTTAAGTSPAAQTFTIGVTGACTGNVIVTPTVTLGSGTGWLAVTPASATIVSGGTATFSVAVVGSALTVGSYTASISLAATNGGTAIAGSPQTVGVALTATAAPTLTVSPATQTINVTTGSTSQPFTISNTGGGTLDWTVSLGRGTPSFITLSTTSGTGLAAGASVTDTVMVNATGVAGGKSYTVTITVTATDPTTRAAAAGSPASIPVTVNVAAPAMQLSSTTLAFSATAGGSNPTAQSIVITNTGGDTLKWTVGTPSQTWLTVTPTSGSDKSGISSSLAFAIDTTSLTANTYTATVVITPSVGASQTVTITLTVA